MKEEKYIQSLFEQARKEAPKLSYDDAADHFKAALAPSSPVDFIKDLFSNITLNVFTMFGITSIIISAAFWLASPTTPESNTTPTITEITDDKKEKSPDVFNTEKNTSPLITENKKEEKEAEKKPVPIIENIPDEKNDVFFADELIAENNALKNSPIKIQLPGISFLPKTENKKLDKTFLITARRDSIPKVDYTEPNFPSVEDKSPRGYSSTINKDESTWEKFTKDFNQEFSMDAARWTNIINEWGEVKIKTWNENKVEFDIVATVSADKPEKAKKVLENINVKFLNSKNGISAETIISNKKAIKWNRRKNWEANIDYVVYLPKNSNLKLYHYNGDVFVEELYGAGQFTLDFSDLEIAAIGDHSKIHIKNGKAKIDRSGNLETDLHFSELLANEVGDLKISAKNSTLKAKKAGNINSHSQWGKYKFGHIGNYETTARGDKVEIETAKQLTLDMTNGKLILEKAEDTNAKFHFMQLEADELGEIEMNLKNSDLKVDKAGNVKGTSEWGKLILGDIKNYHNKSSGTKVEINSVSKVTAKGNNTKMTVGTISGDIDLDMHFGGCSAQLLKSNPNMELIGQNADFEFLLPANAQFKFDVQSNTNNFELPSQSSVISLTEKNGEHKKKGYFINEKAGNQINAKLEWGKLEVRVE